MLREQRRFHAWIWWLLAPLALVVLLSSIVTRPADEPREPTAPPDTPADKPE